MLRGYLQQEHPVHTVIQRRQGSHNGTLASRFPDTLGWSEQLRSAIQRQDPCGVQAHIKSNSMSRSNRKFLLDNNPYLAIIGAV
jgi:hypothetical protein